MMYWVLTSRGVFELNDHTNGLAGKFMQHLKQLLIEKNVTQTQLAQLLGRNKSAITNLLQGKRQLKAQEVVKIASFLQVSEALVLGVPPLANSSEKLIPVLSESDGSVANTGTSPLKTGMVFSQPVEAPNSSSDPVQKSQSEVQAEDLVAAPLMAVPVAPAITAEPIRIPFHGSVTTRVRKSQCVVRVGEGYAFEDIFFATDDSYALEVLDNAMDKLGFMPGDVVLSELGVRVKPGDIAVVQHYHDNRIVVTLRKYEPPFLVPYSTEEGIERLHEERTSVQIVSPVLRLIRLMQ